MTRSPARMNLDRLRMSVGMGMAGCLSLLVFALVWWVVVIPVISALLFSLPLGVKIFYWCALYWSLGAVIITIRRRSQG